MQENKLAVLFDMDGTLIDTEPLGIATMRSILHALAVELTEEEWDFFDHVWRRDGTDVTFEEFVHGILKKYAPTADSAEFSHDFYERYERAIIDAPVLPGAQKLLENLKARLKLAVVTASTQAQAQAVLARHEWKDVLDEIVSQDEYRIKKPDPASFLMAAERLGVSPAQCIVVEDSSNGARAGKNAGMYVIGVRAGNAHPQDLSAADEVVDTLNDLVGRF